MNEHDRSNLEFLLSASPATLYDWYSKMVGDDHAYAVELLKRAQIEITIKRIEQMDLLNGNNVEQAVEIINQIKSKI